MAGRGRPSLYSAEIAERIATLLADGLTLAAISEIEGMPACSTIAEWQNRHAEFKQRMDKAREQHADALADQVVHISDTERDPQRARNMIEARKWRAGTIRPRTYGPKLDLDVTTLTVSPADLHKAALERLRAMRGDPLLIPGPDGVLVPQDNDKDDDEPFSIFD